MAREVALSFAATDASADMRFGHRHIFSAHVHLDAAAIPAAVSLEHSHRAAPVRPRTRDPEANRVPSHLEIKALALFERIVAQYGKHPSRFEILACHAAGEDHWRHDILHIRQTDTHFDLVISGGRKRIVGSGCRARYYRNNERRRNEYARRYTLEGYSRHVRQPFGLRINYAWSELQHLSSIWIAGGKTPLSTLRQALEGPRLHRSVMLVGLAVKVSQN
jgi:hypothetical protein